MRQCRTGPTGHHRGQPAPPTPEPIVADRIHTAIQPDEPPRAHPLRNAVRTEAERSELIAGDDAPLPPPPLPLSG
jgi:hypothetical protein